MTVARPVRRGLALALLALALALAWLAVICPVLRVVRERQADIDDLSVQLSHLRATLARGPALDRQDQALADTLAGTGAFWPGASAVAVAAAMQDVVRQAVAASGGQIRSASDAGQTQDHGFRRIMVRFVVEGSLETAQKALAAVDAARPSMFVDSLSIRAPEFALASDRPPSLTLDLSLVGYMPPAGLSPESPAKGSANIAAALPGTGK